MRTKRHANVNGTQIEAGTEVKIQKSFFDYCTNRWQHLFIVCSGTHVNFTFYSNLSLVKPYKAPTAAQWFKTCLNDYINAGWSAAKIIKAGLCPPQYRPLLPQYIKYFNLINP